jgi:hypothetical protein
VRDSVEAYFSELRDIHASGAGVAETSYYGPLSNLLASIGSGLKPKVTAIINLRNTGGGIPDGGLFTASQLKGWDIAADPLQGQLPGRGAIEVKSPAEDAFVVAASEQVARYVERYGLVLVTNLRDFVLVGRDANGAGVRTLESCRLAATEAVFWAKVQQPRKYAEDAGEGLDEFLRRVLLHNAPLSDPKDLAWFLASYARTARLRLESRRELPALDQLRSQLEESLGLKFEGEKGDHFFRSTLVQTLFYGMFASWVLWARDKDRTEKIPWDRRFQWETASQTLHVPMVAELFYQFSNPKGLRDLQIDEVLEWAEEVLWRVDRTAFFAKFQEAHAVQYFYEPFLEAFDPQMRKELGVWYTPDEVVKYMVARVDWALREELGITDGLADPSVVVLDPCCGTGAYLVEVLRKIDDTLQAKGADALTRQDVKRAAMDRVLGFEIMPAPFVIAHLQIGILLAELGVPLKDADERAAVYLTNALTGWGDGTMTPPKDKRIGEGQMHSTLLFPEFAEERDAADRIKREDRILVVVGNPPYNGFAGTTVGEERDLSDAYRDSDVAPRPVGQGLNDMYVRFFRLSERQIAERSDRGVVCLISNNAWLDSLSTTGMRERLLKGFDSIYVDNLNGDKYRTGKTTPDGRPDPSVFSTPQNREGIQVGVAIGMLVKGQALDSTLRYRDFWGATKLTDLESAANSTTPAQYQAVSPRVDLGAQFCPREVVDAYLGWPEIRALMPEFFPGVVTSRDDLVVDVDRGDLMARMQRYVDHDVSDEQVAAASRTAMRPASGFDPVAVRRALQAEGIHPENLTRYWYRPLDVRWLYWETKTALLHRGVPQVGPRLHAGNCFLLTTRRTRRRRMEPASVVPFLVDLNALDSGASGFPMYRSDSRQLDGFDGELGQLNVSDNAAAYLTRLGTNGSALFMHCAAILNSTVYRTENSSAIQDAWPRIPLPTASPALLASAELGRRIAAALHVDAPLDGSTCGLGVLDSRVGEQLDPATELAITARWGIAGKGGITMPSTGRLSERPYSDDELAAIANAAEARGLSSDQAVALLGETCFDVYLNDVAYWRCVPANVWRYTIGGYQVIKKWLSYRERALLGRDLKPEEARYVTEMVRRIAALVLMQPELDANYERVKADAFDWKTLQ